MIRLISQSDEVSGPLARYFIAQHMPSVLRKETRNIGVVVEKGESRVARFVGQRSPGSPLDGRSLQSFTDPRVYKMWVRHWESVLPKDDWEDRIFRDNKVTFALVRGGEVTDTGEDSADTICNYLYSTLVSEGGLREALGAGELDEAAEIRADIKSELRRLKIMDSVAPDWCKKPVKEYYSIKGSSEWQTVTFYQPTPTGARIFEPFNLTSGRKQHIKERAGYLAFLFRDIKGGLRKSKNEVNTAAVVRVNEEDRDEDHVKYALSVIRKNGDIVYWNENASRKSFLNELDSTARSAG